MATERLSCHHWTVSIRTLETPLQVIPHLHRSGPSPGPRGSTSSPRHSAEPRGVWGTLCRQNPVSSEASRKADPTPQQDNQTAFKCLKTIYQKPYKKKQKSHIKNPRGVALEIISGADFILQIHVRGGPGRSKGVPGATSVAQTPKNRGFPVGQKIIY